MSLHLVNEIWKVLKPSIEAGDMNGAAETLVNYLVDEDYSPNEIKQVFRGDSDIKDALTYYLESPSDGLYHEVEEDLFDEDADEDSDEDY
jgi:hypothetical protein